MTEDRFTEVTSETWFSRISGAIKGVLLGLFLFIVAFPLLFLNEGRAIKRYKTLEEGGGAVISVPSEGIDPANEGKLVHVCGAAVTEETLTDPVFGVSANALKLKRVVKMYQWRESEQSDTRKKLGGGTETVKTYSYAKGWSEHTVNSSGFKHSEGHQNPASMPYTTSTNVAGTVTLGAFTLSSSLVGSINSFEPLPADTTTNLPEPIKDKVTLYDSGYYLGADSASPQVGDVTINFMMVMPTDVSVMAKQVQNTFEPFTTSVGGSIQLLQTGIHSSEAMIQSAQSSNKILTWILRFAGFLLMAIGLSLIFNPLSVLADVVPILGSIVGAGTGLIAFLLAIILSLITIAVAWIFYRPLLGIGLIIVAVGLIVVIKGKLSRSKAAV